MKDRLGLTSLQRAAIAPGRQAWGRRGLLTGAVVAVGAGATMASSQEKALFSKEHSELSAMEFLVALVPAYLQEVARERFRGRSPKSISALLLDAGDLTGSDTVGHAEFSFFETLLGVPLRDMSLCFKVFDDDDSGFLDESEILSVVRLVTKGEFKGDKIVLPSLMGRKKQVSLPKFQEWITKVKREVCRLEFDLLDEDHDGKLSAYEFARSLTCYSAPEVLKRVEQDLRDSDRRLTFEEFWDFHKVRETFFCRLEPR